MQAYGKQFAYIYNLRWGDFARHAAPLIMDFYVSTPLGHSNKSVLDVCCGTGQMALHFLENGYRVTGLDLSGAMLHHARENTARYVVSGQARFIQADAASFAVEGDFGLAVSTFDALNHLENETALKNCFQCVYTALADGGTFIFDLNTRAGLRRWWNNVNVDDTPEAMIVTRGVFDEQAGKALTRLSGFVRVDDNLYERFEENVYNTVFDMVRVKESLLETGWRQVHAARLDALGALIDEPEKEFRVFFVACR